MKNFLAKFNINLPPLPTAPPTHSPDPKTLIQLSLVIAVVLIFHFSIASLIIAVFSVAVFSLKSLIIYLDAKAPPSWLMILLTIISVGLIIMSYGGWNGQTAGISFLVLLVSLKFLESQTMRDYFIVCLILYFLAASSFLFNSTLPSILLVLLYTIAITSLLFKITNPAPISTTSALKSSSALILKAIPLALFLFFFFPRIQGSFGFLPTLDKGDGSLQNSLVAGDMAAGAFSNELAFQAKFDDAIPPTSKLYWRAKVMNKEVNFSWQVSRFNEISTQQLYVGEKMRQQAEFSPGETSYEILHEPTSDLFLPYLDYVRSYDKGRIRYDYTVALNRAERNNFTYTGTSTLSPSFDVGQPQLTQLISTTSRPTARTQILLNQIESDHNTDTDRANAVFEYFRRNEFNYSLIPPTLNEFTPLDDFLFNTKTGYCEHYASAFTTLLRWLKIPARVVVGYHGGTVNRTGNFVTVRYSDAHAWSEAYLQGTWVRYDATGLISPERIEYGMDALRELWDSNSLGRNSSGRALSNFLNPSGTALTWKRMVDTWSNLKYQWKKWIVDYDVTTQQELLAKIGLNAKNSLSTLVIILSCGIFALLSFYFWQLLPKPQKRSELQKIYFIFLKKVRKSGIVTNRSDTPNEIAVKVGLLHPTLEKKTLDITAKYNELSYGREAPFGVQKLNELKREIRQLSIERTKGSKS